MGASKISFLTSYKASVSDLDKATVSTLPHSHRCELSERALLWIYRRFLDLCILDEQTLALRGLRSNHSFEHSSRHSAFLKNQDFHWKAASRVTLAARILISFQLAQFSLFFLQELFSMEPCWLMSRPVHNGSAWPGFAFPEVGPDLLIPRFTHNGKGLLSSRRGLVEPAEVQVVLVSGDAIQEASLGAFSFAEH